jgi:hypothetical protein
MQAAKQLSVVQDPMKGSRAENAVEGIMEGQALHLSGNKAHACAKLRRQLLARGAHHVLGEVQCNHSPARQGS